MFIMSSCSDFLNIIPMNEIVLDNYWTEKSDVQNVVLSCYTALEKPECLTRMAIWGELRSDNFIVGMGAPNDVNQILKENILTSNDYLNWTSIYSVINRCNTVLHYAPGVHEIDPD